MRPLDILNEVINKRIFLKLKNGEELTGILMALDLHLNLALKDVEFKDKKFSKVLVRGDSIIYSAPV